MTAVGWRCSIFDLGIRRFIGCPCDRGATVGDAGSRNVRDYRRGGVARRRRCASGIGNLVCGDDQLIIPGVSDGISGRRTPARIVRKQPDLTELLVACRIRGGEIIRSPIKDQL